MVLYNGVVGNLFGEAEAEGPQLAGRTPPGYVAAHE
jgi:hypothetical protein